MSVQILTETDKLIQDTQIDDDVWPQSELLITG